jgi:putative membrane protein
LSEEGEGGSGSLHGLSGAAFDKAYADNEVAYHKTVDGTLQTTLIPSASNAELKDLLTTGLKIFEGHEQHAERCAFRRLQPSIPIETSHLFRTKEGT